MSPSPAKIRRSAPGSQADSSRSKVRLVRAKKVSSRGKAEDERTKTAPPRLPNRRTPASKMAGGETAAARRRKDQKEKTRERIVNAATKVLLREGVDGFSMRKLAQQIGYTPTAIYFHFPDREALLSEVVERQFLQFRESFERIAKTRDPIARLRAMGLALIQFAVEHPAHYRCLFLIPLHNLPKGRLIEKGNPSQDCYALLHSTIAEALAENRFLPEHKNSQTLAQVFFAGVHGVAALHLIKGDDDWIQWTDLQERSRTMVEGLIAGLCSPTGGTPRAVASCSRRGSANHLASVRSRK